jgi:hypothetical protein
MPQVIAKDFSLLTSSSLKLSYSESIQTLAAGKQVQLNLEFTVSDSTRVAQTNKQIAIKYSIVI